MRRLTGAAAAAATIASIASASPALAAIAPSSPTAASASAYDSDTLPSAVSDTFTTTMNTPVTIHFTANDRALAPNSIIAHASFVESVTNAKSPWNVPVPVHDTVRFVRTITVPGKGTFTMDSHFAAKFSPVKGYVGPIPKVTYKITDTEDNDAFATISGVVKPAPKSTTNAYATNTDVTKHVAADTIKPQRRAERHFRHVQRHKTNGNSFAR